MADEPFHSLNLAETPTPPNWTLVLGQRKHTTLTGKEKRKSDPFSAGKISPFPSVQTGGGSSGPEDAEGLDASGTTARDVQLNWIVNTRKRKVTPMVR